MNKFLWILILSFSALNATQPSQVGSIQIDNKLTTDASDVLKIEWLRKEEGKYLTFGEKTGVFASYTLKPGNQSVPVPHEANSFKCVGTIKLKKTDKNSKPKECNLSSIEKSIDQTKTSFTLKISEKCNLNPHNNEECKCDILIE